MTDPTSQRSQPILLLPAAYRKPSDTQGGQKTAATSGFGVTTSPSIVLADVNGAFPAVIEAPNQQESHPNDEQQQQQQRGSKEPPMEREFPANATVVRGDEQGLTTGLPCPLCLGDLYQFLVSEKRGFVMCPNRQCVYPFNLPREELQGHFTALPKIDFGRSGGKGKGKETQT